jgi:hypothetical protein
MASQRSAVSDAQPLTTGQRPEQDQHVRDGETRVLKPSGDAARREYLACRSRATCCASISISISASSVCQTTFYI